MRAPPNDFPTPAQHVSNAASKLQARHSKFIQIKSSIKSSVNSQGKHLTTIPVVTVPRRCRYLRLREKHLGPKCNKSIQAQSCHAFWKSSSNISMEV